MLRTDRLLLRRWSAADREPFARMNADPEVMEFFVSSMTHEDSDAFADRIEAEFVDRGFGPWAVQEIASGAFIGYTGLTYQTFEASFTPAFEIGYRLAKHSWGQGYATEAAREALRHGFEQVGLAEVVSMTAVRNVRSQAVMNKLGMTNQPGDDFDHPRVPNGHPVQRHVLYRLTAERWRSLAR
ncbi:MAG: GNAT family N-acetyltransferase [Dermatophilaceae bacterium]